MTCGDSLHPSQAWSRCLTFPVFFAPPHWSSSHSSRGGELAAGSPQNLHLILSWQGEGKYKDDPVDLRLDIERRKKHKERDLKRGKSRESVDSRDSSHSRERSAEKSEKTHKGSKKQKCVSPRLSPPSDSSVGCLVCPCQAVCQTLQAGELGG